jgi:hypothetical protein
LHGPGEFDDDHTSITKPDEGYERYEGDFVKFPCSIKEYHDTLAKRGSFPSALQDFENDLNEIIDEIEHYGDEEVKL